LDLVGGAVAGEIYLLLGLEEFVEGVEELLLDALLAGEEVDVVDEQDVDLAVALAELGERILLDGVDELVGELLRREVGRPSRGVVAEDLVAHACMRWVLPRPVSP
jgi:hypothetical protein